MKMPWIYLILVDLASLAAGVYLVVTEHYGWAWLPFVALFSTGFAAKTDKREGE